MIRVLVVDDSVFMRTIISDMLNRDPAIEVVSTATNGSDALDKIRKHSPDVVTLDIQMPIMDGLSMLEVLERHNGTPRILILSSLASGEAELTERALRLGADDFMLKPRNLSKLRGIEQDLVQKIKHLIAIPDIIEKHSTEEVPAGKVVVIGSSAGGPPMLDALLSRLPSDLGAAVLVTQHLPEGFSAPLAERLNRISRMPVSETQNGDLLIKNRIYISKAGFHSILMPVYAKDNSVSARIMHSKSVPVHAVRPAVDKTFASAARTFGPHTVAVLLSGMGSDGGEGSVAVNREGGRIFVTREEDCLVYGMARSALNRDTVDGVIPFSRLARKIRRTVADME